MLHDGEHPRWLELIPGVLMWSTLLGLGILAIIAPVIASGILLVYAIAWLARALLMSARLIVGYRRYRRAVRRDWLAELEALPPEHNWQKFYHVVIVAVAKEDPEIVEATLDAITKSEYPLNRLIVVVTTEARAAVLGKQVRDRAQKKFGQVFQHLIVTEHPEDISGEVIGKGSNITWAARQVQHYLDQHGIAYGDVICTTLDADNRVHRKYFAALTHKYLHHPTPLYATFQPIPMFFNNIWDVPMPIRSIALGSSFWQIIESTRPYRLRNFSAHAQSFAALVKTNFWSTKTIVEDGHQFWRTYFRFNGQHDVVPISVPIYQDAVLSPRGYWATFTEQYLQKRRWAWGASDIPYVLYHMWGNSRLPFWDKWLQAGRLIEGHFSWATTSVILAFYSWVPVLISRYFENDVLGYTFPPIYGQILTIALVGMAVTLSISMLLLPPRPQERKTQTIGSLILEWVTAPVLLPLSNLLLGALPAIDAQTRLMFGKYLGYRVTEKHPLRRDLSYHPAAN